MPFLFPVSTHSSILMGKLEAKMCMNRHDMYNIMRKLVRNLAQLGGMRNTVT